MEEKSGIISRCLICGREWDGEGCRVIVIAGVPYELEEFVCKDCVKEKEEKWQ